MKKSFLFCTVISSLCFLSIILNAQTPGWQWAKGIGGKNCDRGAKIITDSYGNIYIAGHFQSDTLIINSDTLFNAGSDDIFIAKYDSLGNAIWSRSIMGSKTELYGGITIDSNGYIFISGRSYSPTLSFDSISLSLPNNTGYYSDVFIAKYDNFGNVVWAKSYGGNSEDFATSIVADKAGYIYITGTFQSSSIIFGNDTLVSVGVSDIFLVKFDNLGKVIWAKSAGGNEGEGAQCICTDTACNIYISGAFESTTLVFGSTILTNSNTFDPDIFIAKYDSSGIVIWANSAGGNLHDYCNGIINDKYGNTYLIGRFSSPVITFDSISLINVGGTGGASPDDIFFAKYDILGNILWAKRAGGKSSDIGGCISIDNNNDLYISGNFSSDTIIFGNIMLFNSTYPLPRIFFAKYNSSGNILWAMGDTLGTGGGNGICIDNKNNVFFTGTFQIPSISFSSTVLYSAGSCDIFIAKLDTGIITGMKEQQTILENSFLIHPNPATDNVTILTNQKSEIEILNIQGQIIKRIKTERDQTTIDISAFAKGMYFIKVTTENGVIIKKFIKE